MSKSSPSTSTTVVQNPLANAQLPYLQNMWGAAANLGGWNGSAVDPTLAAGYGNLQNLQTIANWNYGATANGAPWLAGNAINTSGAMLNGTLPQSTYAAGPQIGDLTNNWAPSAQATGNYYGQLLGNTASGIPGYVQPYGGDLNWVGGTAMGLMPYGQQAYGNITGLAPSAMSATQPAVSGLAGTAGAAMANPALTSGLAGVASGAYIDPRTNPALGGVMQAATQPLVNQYMTATAPGTTSAAEQAGRYGSGVMGNQQNINQYNLGQALASATSGIANNAYNTGLGATVNAGSSLGGIYNTGVANQANAFQGMGNMALSGVMGTGQLYGAGANALSGLGGTALSNAGSAYGAGGNLALGGQQAALSGLGAAANAANQGYATGGSMLGQAGQLANAGQLNLAGVAQNAPTLANFPLSQMGAAFNANWLPIQNYASILGGPAGQSSTTSQTTPNYQNIPQSIVSGISGLNSLNTLFSGGGLLSGLGSILPFSDRRLKRDIQRIGTADNGVPLYLFRYKGSDQVFLGVMADEVNPDAVVTDATGYQRVDYSQALR